MSRDQAIPFEGEFNCWNRGFDLPDLILAVCNTGKRGLLRFASAEAEKTLFVRKGQVVFAKSSSEDDRLGEYLLRTGKIRLRDLSRHAHLVRPGKRLGTLLVESGILDPKELVQAVIGQTRAIVLSLFRWTEAWYGFEEQELPSKETITLNLPAAQIIIDGVQMIDSWRRIKQGVGEIDSVYRRVEDNEEKLRRVNLDTASLELLAFLSKPRDVADVCDSSPLPDIDVCRRLWVFRCLGWIEPGEKAETVRGAPPLATSNVELGGGEPKEAAMRPGEPTAGLSMQEKAAPTSPVQPVVPAAPSVTNQPPVSTPTEERVREDPSLSASLADLEQTSFELVIGDSSEPPDLKESTESGDLGLPYGTSTADGEQDDSRGEPSLDVPDTSETNAPSSWDSAGGVDSATDRSSLSDQPPLEGQDDDLEGLGMVLGEEKQEPKPG